MTLVGDVLFRCRADIPDLNGLAVLPQPTATFAVTTPATSTLPAGTYYAKVTQRNRWGETIPSSESAVLTIAAGQTIEVTSALLPTAVAIRVYLTMANGGAGTEIQFAEGTTSPVTISAPPTAAGLPPFRSTAYLLDSDGVIFGASTLYSWLNEGLVNLSRAVGGIQDYSGVPTTTGQPLYVAPQQWMEISDVWYGGYWVKGSQRNQFFRRNPVLTNLLWGVNVSVRSDKQVIEVYPQPDRDSGITATTADMSDTDTAVAVANPGAFLLSFGFAQIGTEIVAYSDPSMSGFIRGLGSTVAQAWPSGTSVTELSLFWAGKRIFQPQNYQPGQSLTPLAVPNGWEAILPLYMLSLAAKAQQDYGTAESLNKQFFGEAQQWLMASKGVVKFVQVGGTYGGTTPTFSQTIAGGIVVP